MADGALTTVSEHASVRMRAGLISVAIGLVMLALKTTAWWLTGSAAIGSDAMESVVHVVATLAMLTALRIAMEPPDANHPYGHGKVGYISVGFEGGLVAAAGAGIIGMGIYAIITGAQMEQAGWGLAAVAAASVINALLGWWLVRVGKRTGSSILIADGKHVSSDAWTSGGVIVGVLLAWWTDITWLDGLTAALVGVHVLIEGGKLVREAWAGLVDETDHETIAKVVTALNRHREPTWLDVHQLRAHQLGDLIHIDMHLVVPGEWTISHGHDVVDRLETIILDQLDRHGSVLIHLDPADGHPDIDASSPAEITVASATRIVDSHEHLSGHRAITDS